MKGWSIVLTTFVLCGAPAWAGPAEVEGRVLATELLSGTQLTLYPNVDHAGASLRVAGPEGYALTASLPAGSPVTVDLVAQREQVAADRTPADWKALPNGEYVYELVVHGGGGERGVQTGSFSVVDGVAISLAPRAPQAPGDEQEAQAAGGGTEPMPQDLRVSGDFDDFVSIRNVTGPSRLNLNATDSITVTPDAWRLFNNSAFGHRFEIRQGSDTVRLAILQGGNVGIGTAAPQNALHVIRSGGFQIRLGTGGSADYRLDAFGDSLRIGHASSTNQFRIYEDAPLNSLTLRAVGVGVGTTNPLTKLFVTGSNDGPSETQIQVRSTSGVTAPRQMLGYVNNGPPSMAFTDTSINQTWLISSLANGQFVIKPSGPVNAMRIAPNGNVFIAGTLTQGSSREIKEAIEPADPRQILDRVMGLELSTWRYRDSDPNVRHLGPMAEDFSTLFGLGSTSTGIAAIDADGVALAAIQGLYHLVEEKDAALAERDVRIESLEQRLLALESLVTGR